MQYTREDLLRLLEERQAVMDWSDLRLAKEAGVKYDVVRDFKRGKTHIPRGDKLQKILNALQATEKGRIPIIGYVGAGAKIFPIDDLPLMSSNQISELERIYTNCEFVDAPPGVYHYGVVALRVQGDSMMPFMPEGTVVYYAQRTDGGCDDYLNQLCVVQIKDGPTLLKTLKRGHQYGRYSLMSYNADLIEDVELEWCAKIIFIKPR